MEDGSAGHDEDLRELLYHTVANTQDENVTNAAQ